MDFKENPKTDFRAVDQLSQEEAEEEVEALREGIEHHNYLYYVKNRPEISDEVYDRLFRRLQELEEAFPVLQSNASPTRRVGVEPVDELKKVAHAAPMLSLNAALEEEDVEDFHDFVLRNTDRKKVEYVLEPKFDGLSVEVVYEGGTFRRGATRGNGEVGEDISENLRAIRALPMRLRKDRKRPSYLAVRGEVFMQKKGFQQVNKARVERGEEPFANPRNAAAGTMRQLDPKRVADKPLDIYFYEILRSDDGVSRSHWEILKALNKWGLKIDAHAERCSSFGKIKGYHRRLAEQREDLAYEIDGIVIKLDDYGLREKLGIRHRSPRWALAWKFPSKKEVTTLEEIVVQVGRTGILTPVALLQPVEVGGVTVSRATLHNEDEVEKKDVRPGDGVRIGRAGDVIPEVVERVKTPGKKRGKPFSMPDRCPACGAEVVREGAYNLCPAGLSCPPQRVGRIIHYASRDALDIEGLGRETAKDLVEKGLVGDVADLYKLSIDDLLKLEGFAEKSATKLHQAIQETKKPRLDRFLYALGVRHVGQRVARTLAQACGSLEALREAEREDLQKIGEIGPEIAASVARFFQQQENREVLDRLAQAGVQVEGMPKGKQARPLQGKTFVFTGKLEGYTREEAQNRVEALGARATSSVSGETDYLVVGGDPGSKLEEAKQRGAEILRQGDFEKLLERNS